MIAKTPPTPYYAVIFTSTKTTNTEGYGEMADRMAELAAQQPGYLGIEHAGDSAAITVSYWKDLESIRNWKRNAEHMQAQTLGKERWYESYKTRVCLVERDYGKGEGE
jgi:heme-degrading monooxygenase HmoA